MRGEMMDLNTIAGLIGTLGFPIVAVIALGWFIWRIYKRSEQREDELRQELKENREINREAIKTIALYAERLEVIERDVNEIKEHVVAS